MSLGSLILESSMKMFASESLRLALIIAVHSSTESCPLRAFSILTPATEHIDLCAICVFGISREKIAQFFFPSTAAFVTMFMARDVFPTPGRAASKIRSEF